MDPPSVALPTHTASSEKFFKVKAAGLADASKVQSMTIFAAGVPRPPDEFDVELGPAIAHELGHVVVARTQDVAVSNIVLPGSFTASDGKTYGNHQFRTWVPLLAAAGEDLANGVPLDRGLAERLALVAVAGVVTERSIFERTETSIEAAFLTRATYDDLKKFRWLLGGDESTSTLEAYAAAAAELVAPFTDAIAAVSLELEQGALTFGLRCNEWGPRGPKDTLSVPWAEIHSRLAREGAVLPA